MFSPAGGTSNFYVMLKSTPQKKTAAYCIGLQLTSAERCWIDGTMVPPVAVSPLIKTARWSALIAGIIYGKRRYDHLKPIAAEERRVEEEEKKIREENERIAKELAEASEESILK